ncbi:MAG: hypothetical protein ACYTFY_09790 [Planctomycetota bacterium]
MLSKKTILLSISLLFLLTAANAYSAGAFAGNSFSVPQTVFTNIPVVEQGSPEDIRLNAGRSGDWQDTYSETGMTFIEYVTSDVPRPAAGKKAIYLQPCGNIESSQFKKIARLISAYFSLPVKLLRPVKMKSEFYNKINRKYDGDEILLDIRNNLPADAFAFAAVTDKDMFSGRLSAVFGLAYCDLRSCIISTNRTCADPHRISGRKETMRIFKLVAHELCHVMGLPHCSAHKCTMNGTMSLADVNRAPLTLCSPCHRKLQWNIGFDSLSRYKRFSAELSRQNLAGSSLAMASRISRLEREKSNAVKRAGTAGILAYKSPEKILADTAGNSVNRIKSLKNIRKKTALQLSAASPGTPQKRQAVGIHGLKNLKKLSPDILAAARPAELRGTKPALQNTENKSAGLIAARMEDLW